MAYTFIMQRRLISARVHSIRILQLAIWPLLQEVTPTNLVNDVLNLLKLKSNVFNIPPNNYALFKLFFLQSLRGLILLSEQLDQNTVIDCNVKLAEVLKELFSITLLVVVLLIYLIIRMWLGTNWARGS